MKIKKVTDKAFLRYGNIVELNEDIKQELDTVMAKNIIPQSGNVYVADDEMFSDKAREYFSDMYGEMAVQMGFCNGKGNKMDALEYHKSSEVLYACTDLILLLGKLPLVDGKYNSSNLEAFYVSAKTLVEIDPLVLHYAPIRVTKDGFKAIIVLPKGTNLALDKPHPSDKKLFATNKWLIAHAEAKNEISLGAVNAIEGDNIEINYGE